MAVATLSFGVTILADAGFSQTIDLSVSPRLRAINSAAAGIIDEIPARGTPNPYRPLELTLSTRGPYRINVASGQQRIRYRSLSATAQLFELDKYIAQGTDRVSSLTGTRRGVSDRPLLDQLALKTGASQNLKSPAPEARPIHLQKVYQSLIQHIDSVVQYNGSITKAALLDSVTEHFHFRAENVEPLIDRILLETVRRNSGLGYQQFGITNPAAPWQTIAPNDLLLIESIQTRLPYHVAAEQIRDTCETMLAYWSLVEKTGSFDVHDRLFIDAYYQIKGAHGEHGQYVKSIVRELNENCEYNSFTINQGERSLDLERLALGYLFNLNDDAKLQANTNVIPWNRFTTLFKIYLLTRNESLNASNLYVQYLKAINIKKKDCEKVQEALQKKGITPKKPCASLFWTEAEFIAGFPRVMDLVPDIIQYANLVEMESIYASPSALIARAAFINEEIGAGDTAYGAAGAIYGTIILETRRRRLGSNLTLLKEVNFAKVGDVSPTNAFDLVTYWTLKPGAPELLEAFKTPMNSANKLDDFLRDLIRTETLGTGLKNMMAVQGVRSIYRDSLVKEVRDLVDAAQETKRLRPLVEARDKLIADLGMPHFSDTSGGAIDEVGQIFLPPDSRVARTFVRKGDTVESNQPLLAVELDFERRGRFVVEAEVINARQIAEGAVVEFGAGTSDFRIGGKIESIANLDNGKVRVELTAFPFVPRKGTNVADASDVIRLDGHTCSLPAYAATSICTPGKPWFPGFGTVKAEIKNMW